MQEYVSGVEVRMRKENYQIRVFDSLRLAYFQNNPMMLLDGIPVFNTNKFMSLDPLTIQRLDVITKGYFQGKATYDGIVSYVTYNGDLGGYQFDPGVLLKEYNGALLEREFYSPKYDTPESVKSRLPDFRNLLYWAPEIITTGKGDHKIEFFTSDETGHFTVVLQGITNDGLPGVFKTNIEVVKD